MDKSFIFIKWYLFFPAGVVWLFWQLFLDELTEKIRGYIPEGGLIMFGITHPYVIMPIILIILGIYGFTKTKRADTPNRGLLEEIKSSLIHIDTFERAVALKQRDFPDKAVKQVHIDFTTKYPDLILMVKTLVENAVVKSDIDYLINFLKFNADILDKNGIGLKTMVNKLLYTQAETELAQKEVKLKLNRNKRAIIQKNIERIRLITYGINSSIVVREIAKKFPGSNNYFEVMLVLENAESEMRKLMVRLLNDIDIEWKVTPLTKEQTEMVNKLFGGIDNG